MKASKPHQHSPTGAFYQMDPRQQRSRDALQQALISLMSERPLDDIHVREISDTADVALSTFYRHYANKQDLLRDLIENYFPQIIFELRPSESVSWENLQDLNAPPPMLPLTILIEQNWAFIRNVFATPELATVLDLMFQTITRFIKADTPQWEPHEIEWITAANTGFIFQWAMQPLPYDAHTAAKIMHWNTISGIMALRGEAGQMTTPGSAARAGTPYESLS